jgi:hypothetical protein
VFFLQDVRPSLIASGLKTKAASFSETLANGYQKARYCESEDRTLHVTVAIILEDRLIKI